MNRRGFLAGLGALIGGIALDKAVPLGRVWSFPKEIKCLNVAPVTVHATIEQYGDFYPYASDDLAHIATVYYDKMALDRLERNFKFVAAAEPVTFPKNFQTYRF